MNTEKAKNRWIMLFCVCCNTFCLGGMYAWSVFSNELSVYMGWDYGQVTFAYSLILIAIAVMGLVGGALLQRFGPRKLIMTAGVLWGLGWLLTGFTNSIPMLYVCFGLIAGSASGMEYNPNVVTAVRWFPDRKGFASGMAVGVCGVASLVVAPLANFLLTKFDVMKAFRIVGSVFLVISLLTTWYISNPPADWQPDGYRAPAATAGGDGKTWREMLRDPKCYLLWLILLGISISGLMLIGHASRIGQEVAGITSAQAALLVGILAAANFLGRLILGSLSDVLGRYRIVTGVLIICALDMVFLSNVNTFGGFVAAIVIVGLCFGGALATFPAITSDAFGAKYSGINYSIIFTAYGIAAIVGPNVATKIQATSGSYSSAFIFAAVCSLAAAVLSVFVSVLNKRSTAGRESFV